MGGIQRGAAVLLLSFILVLVPFGSVAADDAADSGGGTTVSDALGRTVTVPDDPSRIVLAGRAVALLANALYLFPDVSERVVAVGKTNQGLGDFFPVLDDNAADKSRLGQSAGAEEVLAREPDLVILKNYMRDSLGEAIETAGVPVVYLELETPEQYNRDVRIIGQILGQPERAEEVVEAFERRRSQLAEVTSEVEKPDVVLLSVSGRGGSSSFRVAPEGWMQGTQVELGGGNPIWFDRSLSPGWNEVQFEQIALWDPDVIVLVSYGRPAEEVRAQIESDAQWRTLQAVQEDRVLAMPADYHSWGQPDTRWILGAEWLAHALHAEEFDEPFGERIYTFFNEFYGMDRSEYRRSIEPRLSGDLLD